MKTLSETLRKLSKEQNKSQIQLANFLGYSKGAVSQWFKGITEPNIATLILIAQYFNVSLDYLLTGDEMHNDVIIIKKDRYNQILKLSQEVLEMLKEK